MAPGAAAGRSSATLMAFPPVGKRVRRQAARIKPCALKRRRYRIRHGGGEPRGKRDASWDIHDAGAPADALVHRHAGRGRGEVALRRPARLRRVVGRRAFLGDHRADPLAADVHGGAGAAHQEPELRHRGDLFAEPRSGEGRGRSRAIRSHDPRPLHARRRPRRPVVRLRAVRQCRPRRAHAQVRRSRSR